MKREPTRPKRRSKRHKAGTLLLTLWATLALAAPFNPETSSMETLVSHAQRYGSTPEKRDMKKAAKKEIFRRGDRALRYLMDHAHLENMWIRVLADQLVRTLDTGEAVPVLLGYLDSDHEDTRKFAAYFLGFHDTPQHAARLLPLLEDDKAAGSAIRTLGKWRSREAVPRILPYLSDPKERRRIVAVNALRDIGDDRAVLPLMSRLADPVFTVRRAAARALVTFGDAAESVLLKHLPFLAGPDRREVVRVLGTLRSREAVPALRKLLKSLDPGLAGDAAQALLATRPDDSAPQTTQAGINCLVDDKGRVLLPGAIKH